MSLKFLFFQNKIISSHHCEGYFGCEALVYNKNLLSFSIAIKVKPNPKQTKTKHETRNTTKRKTKLKAKPSNLVTEFHETSTYVLK